MFKHHYKQLANVKFKPSDMYQSLIISLAIALSHVFLAISSFPQLLRYESDMVASYHIRRLLAWIRTSNAV